jgi:hypothetical protein
MEYMVKFYGNAQITILLIITVNGVSQMAKDAILLKYKVFNPNHITNIFPYN